MVKFHITILTGDYGEGKDRHCSSRYRRGSSWPTGAPLLVPHAVENAAAAHIADEVVGELSGPGHGEPPIVSAVRPLGAGFMAGAAQPAAHAPGLTSS